MSGKREKWFVSPIICTVQGNTRHGAGRECRHIDTALAYRDSTREVFRRALYLSLAPPQRSCTNESFQMIYIIPEAWQQVDMVCSKALYDMGLVWIVE